MSAQGPDPLITGLERETDATLRVIRQVLYEVEVAMRGGRPDLYARLCAQLGAVDVELARRAVDLGEASAR